MNGDIYSKRDDTVRSDTQWLSEQIERSTTREELQQLLKGIKGPYSVIFYDKSAKELLFLRDSLGRQTLLLARRNNGDIAISSVFGKLPTSKLNWAISSDIFVFLFQSAKTDASIESVIELPPVGLFCWNLTAQTLSLQPWNTIDATGENRSQLDDVENIMKMKCSVELPLAPVWLLNSPEYSDSFNLQDILRDRVDEPPEKLFDYLLENVEITKSCEKLIQLLRESVRQRVAATPKFCRRCIESRQPCTHAKVGILFSGGVDCTILACLVDRLIDPEESIDLINVSFEKVTRQKVNVINFETPDRVSSRSSLEELRSLNAER